MLIWITCLHALEYKRENFLVKKNLIPFDSYVDLTKIQTGYSGLLPVSYPSHNLKAKEYHNIYI